ncbi:Pleiotropic regulator of exopolysaccharide synthesis, competence and biofilm formation [Streptococcus infantarius subsp. infantarius]|nr:Pleiotropic regulator of exopolysaccharide synthesis, competence and biofilm formation [Streptococcus infantarius subsp. infantarius]MCO4649646.1 Pleiotropic regulator of exopolysaccharide synthesis, competence and biofilm formation [Streptococcus infantarius subsp. infantarius]MCO4652929.1 Pleiotropic regulator of exopolysaccharide synthesis, competence and biofilm formation [Streptococcus infantarius subsp. infantarius]MCO4662713.1 Pleiotropic regulator of exopolysaccharide synthesis, compe
MYQPEKLKARRKELKMTQKDIADQLGISYQAYSAWERGIKEPSKEKVKQLEQILKVPKGYFTEIEVVRLYNTLSNKGKNQVVEYARDLVQKEKTQQVISISENLYEYHVYEKMSAGIGASVYDDRNYDTVYFNEELAHDFASWVSGDSMEPKYHNGSVALIRETGFDYDGAVYAVICNNQTYIKRVYREENGLRLVSINPKYRDIFISYDEDPRVVGIIVGNFMPLKEGRKNG